MEMKKFIVKEKKDWFKSLAGAICLVKNLEMFNIQKLTRVKQKGFSSLVSVSFKVLLTPSGKVNFLGQVGSSGMSGPASSF